jgi:hypothetical protein
MLTGSVLKKELRNFNLPVNAKAYYVEREFGKGINFNEFKSGMMYEKPAAARNLEIWNRLSICPKTGQRRKLQLK